jgi:hypothetical protein
LSRADCAFVGNSGTDQGHKAAWRCFNRPLVHHACRAAVALEFVAAVYEVGITQAKGTGRETAGSDRAVFAKDDAVGVEQNHLAVGRELAKNLAGIIANDSVEQYRRGAGLRDADGRTSANVEALPVDAGFVGALADAHFGAIGADGG